MEAWKITNNGVLWNVSGSLYKCKTRIREVRLFLVIPYQFTENASEYSAASDTISLASTPHRWQGFTSKLQYVEDTNGFKKLCLVLSTPLLNGRFTYQDFNERTCLSFLLYRRTGNQFSLLELLVSIQKHFICRMKWNNFVIITYQGYI